MDDVDAMVKAIEREPDDLTAELALTDMLVELRDMHHTEAAAHAATVMQTARDARDLAEGARLMEPKQPWHDELVKDICFAARLYNVVDALVVLVPGDAVPVSASSYTVNGSNWDRQFSVSVGALWVIRHYRANPSLYLTESKRKRRRRRSR